MDLEKTRNLLVDFMRKFKDKDSLSKLMTCFKIALRDYEKDPDIFLGKFKQLEFNLFLH